MISDILYDAVHEIGEFQQNWHSHQELEAELDVVKTIMDGMRLYLDGEGNPLLEQEAQALVAAIRRIDVSSVQAASQRLLARAGSVGR
jgi:hypothetical protein